MSDGGNSGPASISADLDAVRGSAHAFNTAADQLDQVGLQAPAAGDFGLAGPLVPALLAAHCEVAAQLVTEASMIGWAMDLCADDLDGVDAQAALDLVRLGSE